MNLERHRPVANGQQTDRVLLGALAREADRLASQLRRLQEDMALLEPEAIPLRMIESAQVLDCAEQGLADFASIFALLAEPDIAASKDPLARAVEASRQHRLGGDGLLGRDTDTRSGEVDLF